MSMRQCIGLSDKLYWRLAGGKSHCFKKAKGGGFVSLCGNWERWRSGGQACRRPLPWKRCGACDGLEMARRGWAESGPASPKGAP